MSTILEELWYGNIDPHEAILLDNRSYRALLNKMGKQREMLEAVLSDDKKELLSKYDEVLSDMTSMSDVEAFKYGFRLAVKLLTEVQ